MRDGQLEESLAKAGLRFRGVDPTIGTLPVKAAWLAVSCRREDGRRDLLVERSDAELLAKANAAWFQLASESGLLGAAREFLVGIDFGVPGETAVLRWVRVQLEDDWDVMGAGVESGLLGFGECPEFVMMSLDETVIMRATTWDRRIGVLTIPHPDRVQMIRTYVERVAVNPRTESSERVLAENWLARHPSST